MSEPLDPIRDSSDRRARERRAGERRTPGTALVLSSNPTPEHEAAPPDPLAEAAFTAQMLGQTGQKRGLKGGQPVLEQARSAYLEAAYSGPHDRRPAPGRMTRTKI